MLQQFTWTDFLMVACPLVVMWYAWLFLVYAKGRKGDGFIGLASPYGPVDSTALRNVAAFPVIGSNRLEEELMGKSKLPDGMSRVATSDVVFSGLREDDEPGLVLDILTEVKELFAILAREDGNKQDFFRLIEALKEAYPGIGSHPGISVINAFVVEHAPFLINVSELDALWD